MRCILTFHSVDPSGSVLSFSPRAFREFLGALAEGDVPVRDLASLLEQPELPGVALTFDDGMRSVHTHALPALREHRLPAHLFLSTGAVGRSNRWPSQPADAPEFEMLRWDEVLACHEGGIRIESHSVTHPDLRGLGEERLAQECSQADEAIHGSTGRWPAFFAYPYGFHDAPARDFVRARYRAGVSTVMRTLGRLDDRAALPRIDAYYLRPAWVRRRPHGWTRRGYLAARALLRGLRRAGPWS